MVQLLVFILHQSGVLSPFWLCGLPNICIPLKARECLLSLYVGCDGFRGQHVCVSSGRRRLPV